MREDSEAVPIQLSYHVSLALILFLEFQISRHLGEREEDLVHTLAASQIRETKSTCAGACNLSCLRSNHVEKVYLINEKKAQV